MWAAEWGKYRWQIQVEDSWLDVVTLVQFDIHFGLEDEKVFMIEAAQSIDSY